MKNRAAYMTGIRKLEMRDIGIPEVKEDEVLVKLEYVGICGSDIHYLENGRIGDFVVEGDFILGHECAGVVTETGRGVKALKAGDRVALEPGITCGKCKYCKEGKYNLCPDVAFLATPPYMGAFTNYIAYPENMAFLLPENVTTREGALIEPLAVGIHAANQGSVKLGDSVMILGAGCIGLVTMLACKACGAGSITVVDLIPKRLAYAKKLGADAVIDAGKSDLLAELGKLGLAGGADVVFETAGTAKTVEQTASLVARGGRIVLVGMAPEDVVEYNIMQVITKEAEIRSVFRYRNIYPAAIQAVSKGMIPIAEIVTHEYGFERISEAFDYVINNKNDVVKAVVKMS